MLPVLQRLLVDPAGAALACQWAAVAVVVELWTLDLGHPEIEPVLAELPSGRASLMRQSTLAKVSEHPQLASFLRRMRQTWKLQMPTMVVLWLRQQILMDARVSLSRVHHAAVHGL